MRIIRLKHSLLFIKISPKYDIVNCYFIYFFGWFQYKEEVQEFELEKISLSQIVTFYKILAKDFDRKYRV